MKSTILRMISGWRMPATLHEYLVVSSAFACLLVFGRVVITGYGTYLFLPWNLALAFIPYWISGWMMANPIAMKKTRTALLVTGSWLVFVPNSFYIITDLFHLSRVKGAPEWFDLLLLFSFAWNGIICGVVSIRRVEKMAPGLIGHRYTSLLVVAIMWLSAWGIYIGRFLRYNSWDVLANPFSLAGDILHMLLNPFQNSAAWGMTVCYSIFMSLLYFTIKKLGESFVPAK